MLIFDAVSSELYSLLKWFENMRIIFEFDSSLKCSILNLYGVIRDQINLKA